MKLHLTESELIKTGASIYPSSSENVDKINLLFTSFLITALLILFIIIISLSYILIKYSYLRSAPPPNPSEGNKKFEIIVTTIAITLVTIFSVASVSLISKMDSIEKPNSPDVVIIGHQFWWEIKYPKESVITANELHIPVNKKLIMKVQSADVVHDWWVPALGRKIDLIPGQSNYVTIQAKTTGIFTGACSEFCGTQHAWMRIKVFSDDTSSFNNWILSQKNEAIKVTHPLSLKGKQIFEKNSCGGCHHIKGTVANKSFGPDLTHLSSRSTLLAGKEINTKENLKKWIANPQKIKPGCYMPNFILSDDDAEAMASYLTDLK